jgi:hypothetical protein
MDPKCVLGIILLFRWIRPKGRQGRRKGTVAIRTHIVIELTASMVGPSPSVTRGVSHRGLATYIKKYFTMPKYNLPKKSSK